MNDHVTQHNYDSLEIAGRVITSLKHCPNRKDDVGNEMSSLPEGKVLQSSVGGAENTRPACGEADTAGSYVTI